MTSFSTTMTAIFTAALALLVSLPANASINDCSISGFGNIQLHYVRLQPGQYVDIPTANCRLSCGADTPADGAVTVPMTSDSCSVAGPAGSYFTRAGQMLAVTCPMQINNHYYFVACMP